MKKSIVFVFLSGFLSLLTLSYAEEPKNFSIVSSPISLVKNGSAATFSVDLLITNLSNTTITGVSVQKASSPNVPFENLPSAELGDISPEESKSARVDIVIPGELIDVFNDNHLIFWKLRYTDAMANQVDEVVVETPIVME